MQIPSFLVVSMFSVTIFVVFVAIEIVCQSWIFGRYKAQKGFKNVPEEIEECLIEEKTSLQS